MSGITKVASAELRDYLAALQHNIMPAGSMSPINWFKILAHTGYTASVTLHVPVHADAHMGDEFKFAVEAAVEHNLAYVRDNWDRIRVATGFYPWPLIRTGSRTSAAELRLRLLSQLWADPRSPLRPSL